MKKTAFFFVLFFLSFSYTEEYLLEKAQNYFNSIEWAENSMLDFSTLPTPYSVGDNGVDSTFLYADNIREDDVLPEVKDLGVLDYARTPFLLLSSMKAFSKSIIDKKIKENLSAKGRDFLAPLFEYRLSSIKGIEKIDYAFFSAPTFEGGKRRLASFV